MAHGRDRCLRFGQRPELVRLEQSDRFYEPQGTVRTGHGHVFADQIGRILRLLDQAVRRRQTFVTTRFHQWEVHDRAVVGLVGARQVVRRYRLYCAQKGRTTEGAGSVEVV